MTRAMNWSKKQKLKKLKKVEKTKKKKGGHYKKTHNF
jgi:hypothetical protein